MKAKFLLALAIVVVSCTPKEIIPDAPDYSLGTSWYTTDRNSDIDLFYISSTETFDYKVDKAAVHYAWAADSSACEGMRDEMKSVDRLLSGDLNYFSPFYRQVTMETFADTTLIAARCPLAIGDVKEAFRYYLDNLNGGRPFVLAGFSQGGQILVELLKELPESLHERMVAAYVMGWKITESELENYSSIIAAEGADDIGVTICYNSVKEPEDANPLVSYGNSVAINPVNWCTDATPAVLFDTLTVTLDPATKLLLVDGFEGTGYAWKPYFEDGCYHTFEIRWYRESLRQNIADRCEAYRQSVQI